MVLKRGHFGQQIRNNWEVSKCRAGEGWLKNEKEDQLDWSHLE
jgi:hypothetical protein